MVAAVREQFFEVPRSPEALSVGRVELPVLIFDASAVLALMLVDAKAAREQLEGTGLAPVSAGMGRAFGGVAFFDYRNGTLGSYREAAATLMVVPHEAPPPAVPLLDLFAPSGKRCAGFHILDLPVTTAFAEAAGRELWGLPKRVCDISVRLGAVRFAGQVHDRRGTTVVDVRGALVPGVPLPAQDLVLWSVKDGERLRTVVDVKGPVRLSLGAGVRVTVGAADEPMTAHLRHLKVDGRRPVAVVHTGRFRARVHGGERA